jgi:hypothetical protein
MFPSQPHRGSAGSHAVVRPLVVVLALLMAPALSAQEDDPDDTLEQFKQALADALATIHDLEARVSELETRDSGDDPLEDQLQRLLGDEEDLPPQRTVFPSSLNPRIGVSMDSVISAGQFEDELGEDGDRFSLRETEIDISLPVAPFADGVLIPVFEDSGNGEFESTIEEGYVNVSVGRLLDTETAMQARIGRFRLPFGHDNQLHTHDLIQTDRTFAVTQQLGDEGLIGDGLEFTFPLGHRENEDGLGRTTTLKVGVVNGEVFTGDESLLNELADDAGLSLDSDAPLIVARASHFVELDERSDLEVGASFLEGLASDAVTTDAGTNVEPTMYALDVTFRTRDDESGVGSWLVAGEVIQTEFDYNGTSAAGFPTGHDTTRGYALTAQRQLTPDTYVGMRYGRTDRLGSDDEVQDFSPYISWYADEFFRLRVQGEHVDILRDGASDSSANRVFLQATWNFGAHKPHPYWSNR